MAIKLETDFINLNRDGTPGVDGSGTEGPAKVSSVLKANTQASLTDPATITTFSGGVLAYGGKSYLWNGAGYEILSADNETNADISALTVRGRSIGQWSKPVGRAATQAEIDHANADLASPSVSMLERLLTNRAAGNQGLMNDDGNLGHYLDRSTPDTGLAGIAASMSAAIRSKNAFTVGLSDTTGGSVVLTGCEPAYRGQIMVLQASLSGAANFNDEFRIEFPGIVDGVCRRDNRQFIHGSDVPGSDTDARVIRMRHGETLYLVGATVAGRWSVLSHNARYFSGLGWQEKPDGTASINMRRSILSAGVAQNFGLPVQISNPSEINITVTDLNETNNPAVNDPLPAATDGAEFGFVQYPGSHTNSAIMLGVRSAAAAPGLVSIHIEGAKLDYGAL